MRAHTHTHTTNKQLTKSKDNIYNTNARQYKWNKLRYTHHNSKITKHTSISPKLQVC